MGTGRVIRQREDNPRQWDVIEEGADGKPAVSIVDTATASRMQKEGGRVVSSEDWGRAARAATGARNEGPAPVSSAVPSRDEAAEERAGVLARGGTGQPGMVHALDENGEPVVASLDTVRQRGWEVVTPDMAARAGEESMRRRSEDQTGRTILPDRPATQVAEMRSAMGLGGPRPFSPLSGDALAQTEMGVQRFLGQQEGGIRPTSSATRSRPTVSVRPAGTAAAPRTFQSLATSAPAAADDVEGVATSAAAGGPTPAGDAEFAAAQEQARMRRIGAGIGRAGAMANQALSGVGFDGGVYDDAAASADLPVRDLLAKRAADKSKALSDPDSEQSIRFRSAVQKAMPGVYSAEELASMTAADEPLVMRYGDMRQRLDERAVERARDDARRAEDMGREDARLADDREWRAEQADLARQDRRDARTSAAADRALRREELASLTADKVSQRQAERAEQQTRQFSETVGQSGAPNFYSQYGSAKTIMDANPDDLPGYGSLAGRLPDALTSKEGVDLRQSLGQMLAEYRKGVTGAGMSDTERTEYGQITGLLQSGDEASVRQGADRLRQAMDARLQASAGGFRPDVVEEYGRRVPSVGAALRRGAGEAPATAPQRIQRNGKTYEFENGQWFEVL